MVRKSKRKPRKSFIDEGDTDENSNSNVETDLGRKEGEGGMEECGEKVGGGAQQGEVLPSRDASLQSMKSNMEERDETETGAGEFNNSLDKRMKFEVSEETKQVNALGLDMSMLKEDTPEEKESMQSLMRENKVSNGAAALLEAVAKKSNPGCGCAELFLEGEERCQENCANRKARRECTCVPPCSNMAVQMLRQGETAPLVKEEADRLVTMSSVPDNAMLGELTGEIVTKEEMSRRLEEYKVAGMYSRVWKLGPDLRMDTEPLQRPGSAFRVAKHSCMPSAVVKEWEVNGTPCLMVVATRSLAENEEISLDLGYQLEVIGATKLCDCGTIGCRLLLGATVTTLCNSRCCSCQVILPPGSVPLHPTLGLQSCADCRQRLPSIDWEEKTGEKSMCRCCGSDNQAALFPCSNCPASFCKPCLAKSLGKPRLNQSWRCLLCFSAPLRNMKLSLVDSPAGGQESVEAAGGTTASNRASPGHVWVVRGKGPRAAPARGRGSPSGMVPSGLRQNLARPGQMRPRMMPGMRPRMIGSQGTGSRRMGSPGFVGPRRMWTPGSVGPRTPINRPVRLTGLRPRYPISPRQDLMQSDQTTQEMNHLPVVSAASVPSDWEDPASDPLAEETLSSLTYQDASSNMNTSETFNDVNQNPGEMAMCATMPSAMKRPRIMVGVPSRGSPGSRMPPGPRMWKSPAPSPLFAARPLSRVVSQPFHVQAEQVEIVDVEKEEENNTEVVLQNLPPTVTLIRTNEVSLEREARKIAEVMTRVANKLAGGGGAILVDRDILDAKKLLNGMVTRLDL